MMQRRFIANIRFRYCFFIRYSPSFDGRLKTLKYNPEICNLFNEIHHSDVEHQYIQHVRSEVASRNLYCVFTVHTHVFVVSCVPSIVWNASVSPSCLKLVVNYSAIRKYFKWSQLRTLGHNGLTTRSQPC